MTPAAFRAWRNRLGLTQAEAARRLGISPSTVKHYERGARSDRGIVTIPKSIRLAMATIELGLNDYDGQYGQT